MITDILFGALAGMILLALIDECARLLHKRRMRREQDAMASRWQKVLKRLDEPK